MILDILPVLLVAFAGALLFAVGYVRGHREGKAIGEEVGAAREQMRYWQKQREIEQRIMREVVEGPGWPEEL